MANKRSGWSTLFSSIKNLFIRLFGFGKAKESVNTLKEQDLMSPTKQIMKKFVRNRIAITGFVIFFSILGFIVIGSSLIEFRPAYQENSQQFLQPGLDYLNVPHNLKKSGVKAVTTPLGNEEHLIGNGVAFTVAISNDDKIYVWGANVKNIKSVPSDIQARASEIVQMAVGSNHVVILMENGDFLGWGSNNFEQTQAPIYNSQVDLAFGQHKKTIEAYFLPSGRELYPDDVVSIIEEDPIVKVAAGYEYTSILTQNGHVYSWGNTKATNISEGRYSFNYLDVQLRTTLTKSEDDLPQWDLQWRYAHRLTWNTYIEHDDLVDQLNIIELDHYNIRFRVFEDELEWQYEPKVYDYVTLDSIFDILNVDTQLGVTGLEWRYNAGAWMTSHTKEELIDEFDIFQMAGVNTLFRIEEGVLQWKYDHAIMPEWEDIDEVNSVIDLEYRLDNKNIQLKYDNLEWFEALSFADITTSYGIVSGIELPVSLRFVDDELQWKYDAANFFSYRTIEDIDDVLDIELRLTAAGLEWRYYNSAWILLYTEAQLITRYSLVEQVGVDIQFRLENGRLEWKYDDATSEWATLAVASTLVSVNTRVRDNKLEIFYKDGDGVEAWREFLSFSDIVTRYGVVETPLFDISVRIFGGNLQWTYVNTWTFAKTGEDYREELAPNTDNKIVDLTTFEFNVVYFLEDGKVTIVGLSSVFTTRAPSVLGWSTADRGYNIVQVAATKTNMFALKDNGDVIAWGEYNSENRINDIPRVVTDSNIVKIASGMYHVVVLTDEGVIMTWGNKNDLNQLNLPRRMATSEHITANYFNSVSIGTDGSVTIWGNRGYVFGTDFIGADVFKRVIAGGAMTMSVAAIAVMVSLFIGLVVGLTAGFYGKWVDNVLMRFGEIVGAFPFLPLAMTLAKLVDEFGMGERERIVMIMVILGLLSWPGLARLVRGQILSERERDFVMAAKALGIRERHVIMRHILPNVINVVIVSTTLSYAGALLVESGLSFLGFGVRYPQPSWGNMLTSAQSMTVLRNYWWLWIIPAFFIIGTALSINLVGDGLRDAMDPKSSER